MGHRPQGRIQYFFCQTDVILREWFMTIPVEQRISQPLSEKLLLVVDSNQHKNPQLVTVQRTKCYGCPYHTLPSEAQGSFQRRQKDS